MVGRNGCSSSVFYCSSPLKLQYSIPRTLSSSSQASPPRNHNRTRSTSLNTHTPLQRKYITMSFSIRILVTRRAPAMLSQRAAFSTSIARSVGKESALHNEKRAEEISKLKDEHVQKAKDGKATWEEGLASESESAVKADRNESGTNTQEQIKKLQDEAKKV